MIISHWDLPILLYRGKLEKVPPLNLGQATVLLGDNGIGKSSFISFLKNYYLEKKIPGHWFFMHQEPLRGLGTRRPMDLIEELENLFTPLKFQDEFSLGALLSQELNSLSGGENQKFKISLALSFASDYLVLDEPSNNLDQTGIALLQKLLFQRTERGQGFFLITHWPDLFPRAAQIWQMRELNGALAIEKSDDEASRGDSL